MDLYLVEVIEHPFMHRNLLHRINNSERGESMSIASMYDNRVPLKITFVDHTISTLSCTCTLYNHVRECTLSKLTLFILFYRYQ